MYIFGGFNSLLLSDILRYTPERCEAFDSEPSCLRAGPGLRCVWASPPSRCVPWEMATVEQQQKVFEDCPPRPGTCRVLPVSLSRRRVGSFSSPISASCYLYVMIRWSLRWGWGCNSPSTRALGDFPLTKWLGDVSISPSSWSYLLIRYLFPTVLLVLTFLSRTDIISRESGLDLCSVHVCSKNWPFESQQFTPRGKGGGSVSYRSILFFKTHSRKSAWKKVIYFSFCSIIWIQAYDNF